MRSSDRLLIIGVLLAVLGSACRQSPSSRWTHHAPATQANAVYADAEQASTEQASTDQATHLVAWESDQTNAKADRIVDVPQEPVEPSANFIPASDGANALEVPAPLPPLVIGEEVRMAEDAFEEEVPKLVPITLDDVIQSVITNYPALRAALAERQIAAGKELSAEGEFDTRAKGYSLADAMGYYKNYRSVIGLDQPLVPGGNVFGGYKIGDGNFPTWYGERETNEGGEFSLGMQVPLLQNRAIDKRRSNLAQARFDRLATDPAIQAQWLDMARMSAYAYWKWVAAGLGYDAQQELLDLAKVRIRQLNDRIEAGDLEARADIDNRRLIATRETKLIESQRKFQEAAIKLSLFYRSPNGEPIVLDLAQVPRDFPGFEPPSADQMNADINAALAARPELRELEFLMQRTRVELSQAQNMLRPKLDATVLAAKDVGAQASSKGDKTPFQLEAGLIGEVPLQRREARGKIRAAQGKLAQLDAKREFIVNKTVAAVQDAYSALIAASERTGRAKTNLDLARESLQLGRDAFTAGDIDLIVLNIYEQAVTDAELTWIGAQADYFTSLADYEAILANDQLSM